MSPLIISLEELMIHTEHNMDVDQNMKRLILKWKNS